jgi:small-conductance mechanosensitive channel
MMKDSVVDENIATNVGNVVASGLLYYATVAFGHGLEGDATLVQAVHEILHTLTAFIVIFVIFSACKSILQAAIGSGLRHAENTDCHLDETLVSIIGGALSWALTIIFGILALENIGIDMTAAIAATSVASLVVATAATDSVKNFFGLMVMLNDQMFKPGEQISIAGAKGTVLRINARNVTLRDADGNTVYVPNSHFTSKVVTVSPNGVEEVPMAKARITSE